jgi:hypothetical protein
MLLLASFFFLYAANEDNVDDAAGEAAANDDDVLKEGWDPKKDQFLIDQKAAAAGQEPDDGKDVEGGNGDDDGEGFPVHPLDGGADGVKTDRQQVEDGGENEDGGRPEKVVGVGKKDVEPGDQDPENGGEGARDAVLVQDVQNVVDAAAADDAKDGERPHWRGGKFRWEICRILRGKLCGNIPREKTPSNWGNFPKIRAGNFPTIKYFPVTHLTQHE